MTNELIRNVLLNQVSIMLALIDLSTDVEVRDLLVEAGETH